MLVNFLPECATCQPEDTLKVAVPHPDTSDNKKQPIIVLGPYSEDKDWPTEPKIIKGNKLNFLFEAATDYLKEENANKFGFKCDVIGFPWETSASESMLQLEGPSAPHPWSKLELSFTWFHLLTPSRIRLLAQELTCLLCMKSQIQKLTPTRGS